MNSNLFPELVRKVEPPPAAAGAGAPAPAPAPAKEERRGPEVVKLDLGAKGSALRGGAFTLDKWRKLLGGDRLQGQALEVAQAEVNLGDGRIALTIEGKKIGQIQLYLLPARQEGSDRIGITTGLNGPIPNETVQRLLHWVAHRLSSAKYQTLFKIFRLDPDAKKVAATTSSEDAAGGGDEVFERSLARTVAGSQAWRVFHAELEQRRNFHHYLTGNILVVRHEDLECSWATPQVCGSCTSFFNYSGGHHATSRQEGGPFGGLMPSSPQNRRLEVLDKEGELATEKPARDAPEKKRAQKNNWGEVITDMTEDDVIKGGAPLVDKILDTVAANEEKPDLVIVKTSCVPIVIGDDLTQAMAKFEKKTGVPTVFLDNLNDQDQDFFSTMLERLRWEIEFMEPKDAEGRINLVGFPVEPEMDRLVTMAETLGVVVNARIIPEIRLEDLRRYSSCSLQVFLNSNLFRASYEQIKGNVDVPSLYLTPPYGIQCSRDWVEQVADAAVGDSAGLDELWKAEWEPFAEEWEKMTRRAAQHRLGFVLDRRAAEQTVDPADSTGVPIVAALQEMGFELEFLLYEDVPEKIDLPGQHTRFGDAIELEELLRQSESVAFYSEFYFDRRLTRCGKAQFSVGDFQLGIRGTLNTLHHLLRICEMSFYRRYGKYMGRAFGARGAA